MGDPPPNSPGVHPPAFKVWDGRRKAPRDEAEKAFRQERQAEKAADETASWEAKQRAAALLRMKQRVRAVPFQQRRFLIELAAWEAGPSDQPLPMPVEKIPGWAVDLAQACGGRWAEAAEFARREPFEDRRNNAKMTGPAW